MNIKQRKQNRKGVIMKSSKVYTVMDREWEITVHSTKLKACIEVVSQLTEFFDPFCFGGWDEEFEDWRQNALSYLKNPSLEEYETLIKNEHLHNMLELNDYDGSFVEETTVQ
jgi:hypothetical protein